MTNMNENLENVTTTEETAPVAPAEEVAAEETTVEEIPVEETPAEPAPKENWFSALRSRINITRKGLIIGGIVAAVLIIAIVLIVLLTGGKDDKFEGTTVYSTVTVTVLEDGFKVDELTKFSYIYTGWRYEYCTFEKAKNGTYLIDGETMRLAHYVGDYYLVLDDKGKAVDGAVVEVVDRADATEIADGGEQYSKDYCYYYVNADDLTYSKNDDGTYRLGEYESVKLKDAGDGMYSVVSVNGEKDHDFGSALIKLDSKLGVFGRFYRSAKTYKVIEGEEKTIVRETVEGSEYIGEYWIEGDFLTAFRVSKSCDYLQKQRGDDRIVYLLDEDGEVEDVITITNGKTYLDGVTLKELSEGKFYGIENGQEYRLHLSSNGTYKRYEDVTDGEIRGRAKLVWEPEEKLQLLVDGEKFINVVVDGKKMTYGDEETVELTKVK